MRGTRDREIHAVACSVSLYDGLSVPLLQLLGTTAQETQHEEGNEQKSIYHAATVSDVEVFTCYICHAPIVCYVQ